MRRQRDAAFTDEIITNIKQFQHVEVVCQLSNQRRRPDSYVKLEVDAEDYYRHIKYC